MLIYILLFNLISVLMLYNINMVISIITNSENKFKINLIFVVYVICSIVYALVGYDTVSSPFIDLFLLIIYYLIAIVYLIVVNKCSIKKVVYIFLLYSLVSSLLHSIFTFILGFFLENYLDQIVKSIITFIVNLLMMVTILLIRYCVNNKMPFQADIINSNVYGLILLAIFSGGVLIENQLALENVQFQSAVTKTFTVITIFVMIFIIGSLVFNCISRAYFENVSSILEKQVNEQVDYYKKIDKIDKDLRDFRHDYKNHMICVQSLIEAKEYDEATEYLKGITLHKTVLSRGFSSGNSIVDVLLSDKSEWAEKVGAEIQFEGVIYENIPPADLCTILSNAIDNAIEACEKIQSDEQKIISVKCSYIKRIQFIDITNPVSEDVKITNNVVETSKSDKNIHGIGLYNIRRTVMKYDGEFDISCKDKTFVMSIAFKAN